MSVDRRELFRMIGAGVVAGNAAAQHEHGTLTTKPGDYEPRVFSREQYLTLERMLEVLLPADELGASAREAGVGMFLDTTLKYSDDRIRSTWLTGIAAVDTLARESGGETFGQLDVPAATAVMARIAGNEAAPSTVAEKFFILFKQAAIPAYYLSVEGRKSLEYTGDTAIRDFAGCTHSEHKSA
jgi:hypothetical protein